MSANNQSNCAFTRKDKPVRIIIDTDAGADDAVAIALAVREAARCNSVEVVAITCVVGNTPVENVVVNVLKTLNVTNATHIPVYVGLDKSIVITPESDDYFGKDGLGDFEFPDPPTREDAEDEHAVNALIRIVKENPGEITIVAIGPLSNIAMAIRMDPSFRTNLKDLYVLGGNVAGLGNIKPGVEFNFFMDPEASYIVFNSTSVYKAKPIVQIPWETVMNVALTKDWRNNVLGKIDTPIIDFLNKAEKIVLENGEDDIWHIADGYLVAVAINPGMITKTKSYFANVMMQGEGRGGLLVDSSNLLKEYKNTDAVLDLDVERFKKMLLDNFS